MNKEHWYRILEADWCALYLISQEDRHKLAVAGIISEGQAASTDFILGNIVIFHSKEKAFLYLNNMAQNLLLDPEYDLKVEENEESGTMKGKP